MKDGPNKDLPNDEQRLIQRVVAGQPRAEDEFVERYGGFVLALARGRLGCHGEAADELLQEVMAKLWQHDRRALRAWRGNGRFTTYLTVIVTHLVMRSRQVANRQGEDGLEDLPKEPCSPEPAADEQLATRQRDREVWQALDTLSQRDQLLLNLRFADERSPKEISALLGQAPGTTRKALHDALGRLRHRLRSRLKVTRLRIRP